MKTVLVTGANGFMGNHLIHELIANDITVVGVGGPAGSTSDFPALAEYRVLDLMDSSSVKKLDFHGIDGVIHLAGLASAGPSFTEPMHYITTNIGMEINLFEAAMAQEERPRFLIISSGSLYDSQAPLPLTESSVVFPSSPYAVSKIGQEQMAHYYGQRGFESIIARPFNHIGPGQNLGFIVPDLTKQFIDFEKGSTKKVLVGNLDAKRDYTDVRDIARAYRLLLEKGTPGETYNICSGKPLSGHDIMSRIVAAVGAKPTVTKDPSRMRPSDTPVLYGSHQKITDHTGWQPEIAITTTIDDVVTDWRTRK